MNVRLSISPEELDELFNTAEFKSKHGIAQDATVSVGHIVYNSGYGESGYGVSVTITPAHLLPVVSPSGVSKE